MTDAFNGIYAAYLSGKVGQGFAMLVFQNGKIAGAGAHGEGFDGHYEDVGSGVLSISISTKTPPNVALIQGGTSGADGESYTMQLQLPHNFFLKDYFRIDTIRGPINVKIVKVRKLFD